MWQGFRQQGIGWMALGALLGGTAGYFAECVLPEGPPRNAVVGVVLGILGGIIAQCWFQTGGRLSWKTLTVTVPLLAELEFEASAEQVEKTFTLSEAQRQIGWRIYVQVVTRVSVQSVEPGTGTLRASLSSLHALMQAIRSELRDLPPTLLSRARDAYTVETLAAWILNAIRSLLAKWHQPLADFERVHGSEAGFPETEACEQDLERIRGILTRYAQSLSDLLEVQPPRAFMEPPSAKAAVAPIGAKGITEAK